MKDLSVLFTALMLSVLGTVVAYLQSFEEAPKPAEAGINTNGLHGFDFLVGEWRVRHRRLPADSQTWVEFEGTCSLRLLMEGAANMEEHIINAPKGTYRAIGLRSFDAKTEQWSIWWLDGRYPSGPLDPPVQGRFENGIGSFYSDYMDNGKPMRVRYLWSNITSKSARWEQSFSSDGGKTWKSNWIMQFERVS
jgi:hypothetical protein